MLGCSEFRYIVERGEGRSKDHFNRPQKRWAEALAEVQLGPQSAYRIWEIINCCWFETRGSRAVCHTAIGNPNTPQTHYKQIISNSLSSLMIPVFPLSRFPLFLNNTAQLVPLVSCTRALKLESLSIPYLSFNLQILTMTSDTFTCTLLCSRYLCHSEPHCLLTWSVATTS